MAGPVIRTDIVDVYAFRTAGKQPRRPPTFLQLHRAAGALCGTWQPVMGHVHDGDTAAQTALRELAEETGYTPQRGLVDFWQLESVNTYFLASHESIVMSPCFAALIEPEVEPILNEEHDAYRWIARDHVDNAFVWPGQRIAIEQIVRDLIAPGPTPGTGGIASLLRIAIR